MQTSSEQFQGAGAQPPLAQMKLSRAGELAKSGDLEAALVMLLQMEPTPAALDLRARIELQRGRYADARDLWNEVLEQVPDHAGARKGLRGVQNAALRGKLLRRLGLAGVLLAAAYGLFLTLRPSAEPEEVKAHVQPARLPPRAAAVPRAPQPAPVAAPAPPSLPEIALPEGVSMRREERAQIYSFDGGLFSEGVTFVAGGREKVTAIGRALAPYTATIQIELIGHVDTLPAAAERQSPSNTALPMQRAYAVMGRLELTTRIPAEALVVRAIGGRLGPHSDEPGDPRNRTVDIRVSLRAEP